jgi:hypothetical protein
LTSSKLLDFRSFPYLFANIWDLTHVGYQLFVQEHMRLPWFSPAIHGSIKKVEKRENEQQITACPECQGSCRLYNHPDTQAGLKEEQKNPLNPFNPMFFYTQNKLHFELSKNFILTGNCCLFSNNFRWC